MLVVNVRGWGGIEAFLAANPKHVYCGRPGPFGNKYSHVASTHPVVLVASRAEAIQRFREDLQREWDAGGPLADAIKAIPDDAILGCWCAPLPCHCDVISEFLHTLRELHR